MPGRIEEFLESDHHRLDRLLQRAAAGTGAIDLEPYQEFRAGLLRHIAMEEKVLFPVARAAGDPGLEAIVRQLHADHGALAALTVPTPTRELITTIVEILDEHNPLEEGDGGLYARCEQLAGDGTDELMARMQAVPPAKVSAHFDDPRVHDQIARLVAARSPR
jgi:hemerythrin-like domain-containing protein